MPLLRLQISRPIEGETKTRLLAQTSATVADVLGKPESYMMVVLEDAQSMLLGGNSEFAAFFEVRSVGTVSADQAKTISKRVSDILHEILQIPPDRVYSNYAGVDRSMWGYNGSTFS